MSDNLFFIIFIFIILIITIVLYLYIKQKNGVTKANGLLAICIAYCFSVLFLYFFLNNIFDISVISSFIPVIVLIPFYYMSRKYLNKSDK